MARQPGMMQWDIQEVAGKPVVIRGCTREPQQPDWRERLETALRNIPNAVVVGAKRVLSDGKLFSMGENIVHPKGYHSVGQGLDAQTFCYPEEVDVIAGGVLMVNASAYRVSRGAEMLQTDLGAMQLCLKLRANGGRCVVLPDVTVPDRFFPQPQPPDHATFIKKWGFDYLAPDMEDIRDLYRGTNLLWNVRFLGNPAPFARLGMKDAISWDSYARIKVARQRADDFVKIIKKTCSAGHVLDVACGDGLLLHLMAKAGMDTTGVDADQKQLDAASKQSSEQRYPKEPPKYFIGQPDALPLKRESLEVVTMINVMEYLLNPARALREAERVLVPGGHLIIVTPERQLGAPPDCYRIAEYTIEELTQLVLASGAFEAVSVQKNTTGFHDMVAIFRK